MCEDLHNVSTWLKHFQEKYVSNHEKKRKEKKRKENDSASINRKKSITSNSSYVIRLLLNLQQNIWVAFSNNIGYFETSIVSKLRKIVRCRGVVCAVYTWWLL